MNKYIKYFAAAVSAVTLAACGDSASDVPTVYFTRDISPAGLVRAYEALGWTPHGKVGIKMSTGESSKSNYLRPELIKDLVAKVDGTIVECNTAYGGNRSDSESHWAAIRERGFLDVAPVDIMDEDGDLTLRVNGGNVLSENYVGSHFDDYGSFIVLSHFKGHAMAGFGGALKNISIGFASSTGKKWIHSGGTSRDSMWGGEQTAFLESMADADKAIMDHVGRDNIVFINVLNRISIDCDCDGNPAEPDIHDIGILVSTDPVAIDQAGIDMVSTADGNEKLMERIADRNGLHILESAEKIGVGTRKYKLVDLDKK
ncbi:MAG: DUF362 domain-containing protein [Alphaproteobacteria bacterium]|nr:DUF362 domain-containing protein [Alphaproteobacteria bacterium]